MRVLLLITIILITYGSLYPFNFSADNITDLSIEKVLNFSFYRQTYADILSNVILFIPFGILGFKLFKVFHSNTLNIIAVNLIGFLFAYAVQVMQLYTPDRIPFGGDAIWNLFGCIIGVQIANFQVNKSNHILSFSSPEARVYLCFSAMLLLLNWSPFVPSLDVGTVVNNLKALVFSPSLSTFWVLEKAAIWIVCFYFLAKSEVVKLASLNLVMLVFAVLLIKVFIADSPLNANHLVGGVVGSFVWLFAKKLITSHVVALLMLGIVINVSFYPYELNEHTGAFHWVPFTGALNGNILINILAMIKKFTLYSCLVWSFFIVFKRFTLAAFLVAVLVFISEYSQRFVTQAVPEITDAILVLIGAYMIKALLNTEVEIANFASTEATDLDTTSSTSDRLAPSTDTQIKKKRSPMITRLIFIFSGLAIAGGAAYFVVSQPNAVTQAAWSGSVVPALVFDHHSHTKYSDGELSIDELVDLASDNGCDALAITDHSDSNSAFSTQRFNDISKARLRHKELKIFAAIELDVPSYEGREHINLLVTPEKERTFNQALLNKVNRLTSLDLDQRDDTLFAELKSNTEQPYDLVGIYNHPSRKDKNQLENKSDIYKWNQDESIINSFSGAPGHQNKVDIGSYHYDFKTIDRWDPVVAEIGGTWDQLLSEGYDIWGAMASSDYHNSKMDYPPCGFARTHVYTPSDSYSGILQGIAAGTFWADHGKILSRLQVKVYMDGVAEPAYPGATVIVDQHSIVDVKVELTRGAGAIDEPVFVELISNCRVGEAELFSNKVVKVNVNNTYTQLPLLETGDDKASCYLRARVRKMNLLEPDFMAYTNHVRFVLKD